MSDNYNEPPVFLPGMRQQHQQPARVPLHQQPRQNYNLNTPPLDRMIGSDDIQAALMKRLATADASARSFPSANTSLHPGYPVYRCVDEDHKLMREVAKTDQLGHTDQFIVSENIVQGLILDSNLSVVDLGKEGTGTRKINLVPIKTPPLSNMGTLFVEEAAVNRSSGRSLYGQPRRAGNLLID